MRPRWRLPAKLVFAAVMLALGVGAQPIAHARASDASAYGDLSTTVDDNALRFPTDFALRPGLSRADLLTRLDGGFALDETLGSDSVFLKGSGGIARYRRDHPFDNQFYDLSTGLDWLAARDCKGVTQIEATETQSDLQIDPGSPPNTSRLLSATSRQNCTIDGIVRVEADIEAYQERNAELVFLPSNRDEILGRFEADYLLRSGSDVGLKVTSSLSQYPDRGATAQGANLASEVRQTDAVLLADWLISVKTKLTLSGGASRFSLPSTTGERVSYLPNYTLAFDWKPTAKLHVTLSYVDMSAPSNVLIADYYETRTYLAAIQYTLTQKIGLIGNFSKATDSYSIVSRIASAQPVPAFNPLLGSTAAVPIEDRTLSGSLGGFYSITQHVALNLALGRSQQGSTLQFRNFHSDQVTFGVKVKY